MSDSLRELADVYYGKAANGVRVAQSPFPLFGTGGEVGCARRPLFDKPLVVVARKGTLGNPTYSPGPCWVIDTAYAVVAKNHIDTKWLYYSLLNFDLESLNEATGVPSISRDYLYRVAFDKPPLPEQRKIARILTTLDELIEKTEALIAKYQAIKQGMMHDLFTRGVDEHGRLRPTYEEAPELYKESELGWIPREWDAVPCDNVCREIIVGIVVQPASYYESEGVPVLRSANISSAGIDTTELAFISQRSNLLLAKSMLKKGDVVTVRTGYPGTSAVVPQEFEGANCVDILISRPGANVRSEYLALWINSDVGKDQVLKKQGGLAQQHFNVGELKSLLVGLPKEAEQRTIEAVIVAQQRHIRQENAHLTKLKLLKAGLMQDLLTGKTRVPVGEHEDIIANA